MDTNVLWNCQGIRPKRKELELYPKENNFDIVTRNKTFLTKKKNKFQKMIVQLVPEVELSSS